MSEDNPSLIKRDDAVVEEESQNQDKFAWGKVDDLLHYLELNRINEAADIFINARDAWKTHLSYKGWAGDMLSRMVSLGLIDEIHSDKMNLPDSDRLKQMRETVKSKLSSYSQK